MLIFEVGNTHTIEKNKNMSIETPDLYTHKWSVFVRVRHTNQAPLYRLIEKVTFDTGEQNQGVKDIVPKPNQLCKKSFQGWGAVEVSVTLHWRKISNQNQSAIKHVLKLNFDQPETFSELQFQFDKKTLKYALT